MARGGTIGYKRKSRNKVRLEKKGSDESDEDYMVDEDESEDEYCSSLAEDELDDSLGKFVEAQDGWFKKRVTEVVGPSVRKGSQTRNKNRVLKRRKKKVDYIEEEEEGEEVQYDDSIVSGVEQWKRNKVSCKEEEDDGTELVDEKPRKKSRVSNAGLHVVSCREETEDEDNDDFDDEDDEEFNPCDDEDDEEFTPCGAMRSTRRNPIKKRVLRTKNRSNPTKELMDENTALRKKKTVRGWGRRRKSKLNSDSDFVSSGSSDYEYTISEEERDQVREATEFCRRLTTSARGSSSLKMIQEKEPSPPKRQRLGRKGKQKLVDMKLEVGKQVCGICLSEEGKRTIRGVLNCCSHYFCFACILEWSKVESRCPLCKQRFTTISRTAQADSLRDAVFPIPERDQVYQPSEEELRGYIDPYENVLCTECQHGGDDALMLLCDLCDSPAHTYCVGLGREVPDGNWYCDGCRPTTLVSSNTQAPNLTPDHGAINNLSAGSSPVSVVRETFDLNEEYVPDTPLTPSTGYSQSPRHYSIRNFQATPGLAFGSAAATLHDRRRIQGHIRHLCNNQSRETFSPRFSSLRDEFQASTTTNFTSGGQLQTETPGINERIDGTLSHQQLHPCSSNTNTRAEASRTPYQSSEGTVPSRTFRHTPF